MSEPIRDVMYVGYAEDLSEAEVERIRERWEAAHAGLANVPRLVILAGILGFQLVTPDDPRQVEVAEVVRGG